MPVASPDVVEEPVDRLIGCLLAKGMVEELAVKRAREASLATGERVDRVLVKLGLADEAAITEAWASWLGLPLLPADEKPAGPVLPELLSERFLLSSKVLPISADDNEIKIAVVDPLDRHAPLAIAKRTGKRVTSCLISETHFRANFSQVYGRQPDTEALDDSNPDQNAGDVQRLQDLASEAPAIHALHAIIERAVDIKASDIHITVDRRGPRLRYRTDGILKDFEAPPAPLHASLISRLKVLADLDIAESRLPQDGRIRYGVRGREIDLRIATMPHLEGEGAVLRILDRKAVKLDLPELGFPPQIESELMQILNEPHGMVLVAGPTGSGKTTTLYAALRRLIRPDRNVVSVEDPVEYQLDGVVQIQVQRKIGLDFPTVLRAVLRQDPDIIMVGEIRDGETAAIANQAALTGHFVLATLHTNSAAAALPRLIDMGIEPYLLASTIRAVLSQRLVRRLCPACSTPVDIEAADAGRSGAVRPIVESAAAPVPASRAAVGCHSCGQTGYRGRFAIAELLNATDPIKAAVLDRLPASEIERRAVTAGMTPLLQVGMREVSCGRTSMTELVRVTGDAT